MAPETGFDSPLQWYSENPVAVLERLRAGEMEYLGAADDRLTDLHLLAAIKSGLLDEWARAFPDPRFAPQIPVRALLAAAVAGAFAGEYALCATGPALHSPAVLAELGFNVAWLAPGAGLSQRGTQDKALFQSDTLRKLLQQIEVADRAAGQRPGQSLVDWFNESVGPAFLRAAGGGTGAWILDCTKLLVNLANGNYEGSAVSKDEDGTPIRGYKLALLSALIEEGRLITRIGWDNVRESDHPVARPLLSGATPLARGDTVLHDRGLIDGATISCLKRDLGVDVVFGLKSNMLAARLAVAQAVCQPASHWRPHPTRPGQEILRVDDIGAPWEELTVPINGCVVRQASAKEPDGYRYWVFASTNPQRTAAGIVLDYGSRSECEEDHRQVKGPNWALDEFTSTSLVAILFHVLVVLIAYNLHQWYAETPAGQQWAGKTKRARAREIRREQAAWLVLLAGPYYAVLEGLAVADELLAIEGEARARLRRTIHRLKAARQQGK
jgi:DDE family transposase